MKTTQPITPLKNLVRKSADLRAAYLHADGHLVVSYDQSVRVGKATTTVQYCEIYERPFKARMRFTGRLVLDRWNVAAFLAVARLADEIRVLEPRLENGSDNSKSLGLAYGEVRFVIDGHSISLPVFEKTPLRSDSYSSICSAGFTIQPQIAATFPEATEGQEDWGGWGGTGGTKIATVHRLLIAQPA